MKRLVATALLFGYVLLVPFCFFGGALLMHADTMNMLAMPAHQMGGCGGAIGGCASGMGADGMDTAAHHMSMYNSITQTPLALLSVFVVLVAALLLYVFSHNWLNTLLARGFLRPLARRVDELESRIQRRILTWLSLFETSPNFA